MIPSQETQLEQAYLKDVLSFLENYLPGIASQKEEVDANVAYGLRHYNDLNPDQFIALSLNLNLQNSLSQKFNQSQVALSKPYFARVDFCPDDETTEAHYIGKMSLMRDLNMLITDWRAPISSLYYEGRIGQAGYDCPDGYISGEITLKRQLQIENGQLEGFTDIDITTNDTFLQAALGGSKDRRLKDIVTTIQAEQNQVIRAPLFKPLIVQGAAGSGKTTIALHRIAYLLYAYEQNIQARNVMIMAPNRFFLSYISDVLPDLGVEQVTQTTFSDFVTSELELKWKISQQMEAVAAAINKDEHKNPRMEAARLKSDLRFMKLIQRYCRRIEKSCLPSKGFIVEGYEIFAYEAIVELFLKTYSYLPVDKRAKELEKNLSNTLKREIPLILQHLETTYDRRREEIKRKMPDGEERRKLIIALLDERDALLKVIRVKAKTELKKYLRAFRLKKPLDYYRDLFEQENPPIEGLFTERAWDLVAKISSQSHKKKILESEDLPPLLWLHTKLFGMESHDIKHIVIDEAQDYSLFQFAALKEAVKSDSFTILGDLHQGILAHRGINDWADVCKLFNCETLTIKQSYRTTVEIMDAANPIISKLYPDGTEPIVPLAIPVIRHGGPVEHSSANMNETIAAWQAEGLRSIAIIGKTAKDCTAIQKSLKTKPPIITESEAQYEGGLLIVPSYLVKGLEFDGVIIAEASKYDMTQSLDIKLLYIAMTRALHKLMIYEKG